MSKTMALKPRMSEKAYAASLDRNTYVFTVPMDSNKSTVADAIKEQFKVTVEDVRLLVVKGKAKQSYKKGRRPVAGKRPDYKKAYVVVKEGDSINIFGDEEKKAEKQEKTAEMVEKAQAKQSAKETKAETKKQGGIRGAFNRATRQTQNKGGDK